MRNRRCPYWLLTALWVAVLGPGGQLLFAQESIPQDILQAKTELTAVQKTTVDAFVDLQVSRLGSDDPAVVAQGRIGIVDPFFLSTSDFFKDYFRQAIAQRIVPLIDADGPLITRLNVAIVSAKLTGEGLVSILENGADDPSPAVRYWIAKAVGTAAGSGAFDTDQQQKVLAVLAERLKTEDASLVLEQILIAIAAIDLPEAIETVLEGLNSRVAFHAANPTAHYKPVLNGMEQLWRKLIGLRSAGTNVNRELYELARVACRYYTLIADQMPDFELPEDAEGEDRRLDPEACDLLGEHFRHDVRRFGRGVDA